MHRATHQLLVPTPRGLPGSRCARVLFAAGMCVLTATACSKRTPEPEPERVEQKAKRQNERKTLDPNADTPVVGTAKNEVPDSHWKTPKQRVSASGTDKHLSMPARGAKAPATATVPVSSDDPLKGKFSLDDATKGLAGDGQLVATIKTQAGTLSCDLYQDRAPITVANFVGLARGLRPYKNPEGKWVKEHAYDGTVFHRIIKGFMIQGGDPEGSGKGEPGYVIPDEIWEGAKHDRRGLLCMANRGPNTNGMQFFIMDGKAAHLDGGYTIFGECSPDATIEKLASWEVAGDHAINPPKIEKVTIARKK